MQPRTALQIPKNLPAPALVTRNRGHEGNQNALANRIDAQAKARNGEGIHVVVKHVMMTEVLNVPIHDTAVDGTQMIATTVEVEDARAIVLDVMVNPIHIHQNNVMSSVQTLHAVDDT